MKLRSKTIAASAPSSGERATPIDLSLVPLGIPPYELEGAALHAVDLVSGGVAARPAPEISVVGTKGGTLGYVPPDKGLGDILNSLGGTKAM